MNEEQVQEKDYFWLYIAVLSIVLVSVVGMVKLSENEKYDPIAKQQLAEASSMNIRVVREY
jgi:hypothetical protein